MQLPFIKRLLPDLPIVPLLMGYQTRDTIEALADALGRPSPRTTACCSSPAPICRTTSTPPRRGRSTRACGLRVAAFDPDRLLELFEQYPEGERGRYVACGGGPAIAVMLAARARGARRRRVLSYAHSGEISGDNSGGRRLSGRRACGAFTDVH